MYVHRCDIQNYGEWPTVRIHWTIIDSTYIHIVYIWELRKKKTYLCQVIFLIIIQIKNVLVRVRICWLSALQVGKNFKTLHSWSRFIRNANFFVREFVPSISSIEDASPYILRMKRESTTDSLGFSTEESSNVTYYVEWNFYNKIFIMKFLSYKDIYYTCAYIIEFIVGDSLHF